MMNINFQRLRPEAVTPTYASPSSAGADLYALTDAPIVIHAGEMAIVHTGIAIALPDGTVGLIYARSGLAIKKGLTPANKVGVIDSDYRGEVLVVLYNHSGGSQMINNGDRIAQLIITPYIQADFQETSNLNDTQRGSGGFGSTGV